MNGLELEQEIGKLARAMMARNKQIGQDLIDHLKTQLSLQDAAGMVLVSVERILWFDPDAVLWTIENVIPADIMQEIQSITSVAIYKRLIEKGFIPGRDLSVDGNGKLLLNQKAKAAIRPH